MPTQGLDVGSTWTDIKADLSLTADASYGLQNIGNSDIWIVEAANPPSGSFYGLILYRGQLLEWKIGSDNLYVMATRSRGSRLAVVDAEA